MATSENKVVCTSTADVHRVVRNYFSNWSKIRDQFGLQNFQLASDGVWVEYRGLLFQFPLGCDGIEYGNHAEVPLVQIAQKYLLGNTVFIDIGAYFGLYSMLIAHHNPKCDIYSLEPSPAPFLILKSHVLKNNLAKSINIGSVAISDHAGTVRFTCDRPAQMNRLFSTEDIREKHNSITVEAITFDEFVETKKLTRIDFVKCDIEGAELRFLKGGQKSLRKFKPPMIVEIDRRWAESFEINPEEVFDNLLSLGYSYWPISSKGQLLSAKSLKLDLLTTHNFLFEIER